MTNTTKQWTDLDRLSELIKDYFRNLHDVRCNQKYAKILPYSFHLDNVWQWATAYQEYWYINNHIYLKVLIGIYGHDSIEDARLTYNDIIGLNHIIDSNDKIYDLCESLGISQHSWNGILQDAAEIIYACTEEKGKNRSERHSDKFYDQLIENELAVFVKLCDLLANTTFSLNQRSSMFVKYKKEFPKFHMKLLSKPNLHKFDIMYNFLNSLYNLSTK